MVPEEKSYFQNFPENDIFKRNWIKVIIYDLRKKGYYELAKK